MASFYRANMTIRAVTSCLALWLCCRVSIASVLNCTDNKTCSSVSKGMALLQSKRSSIRLGFADGQKGSGIGGASQFCPDGIQAQAESYFATHFEQECGVIWADVPLNIQKSFKKAFAVADVHFTDPKDRSCRVIVPLGDGELSFQIDPPEDVEDWNGQKGSAPNENWAIAAGTTKHISGPMGLQSVCKIFGEGVLRTVDVPAYKIQEVLGQVKTYFTDQCDLPEYQLVLTDPSIPNFKAKMSMAEQDGKEEYCLVLHVDYPSSNGAKSTLFCFEEEQISEEQKAMIADEMDEAIRVDQDEPSLLQIKQKKLKRSMKDTVENIFGPWTLMDEHTSPPLCCLCGKCVDPTVCTEGGADESAKRSLIERRPKPLPALKQNSTPTHGSADANRPPPRLSREGKAPRRTVMPGFGDNFHASVLPKRTEADHARIWAQSRALVQTARRSAQMPEGGAMPMPGGGEAMPGGDDGATDIVDLVVPGEYHFYDDDVRSRCFQFAYSQGKCGSCWAFASLGALEKQICMRAAGNIVPSLSREMLVRCSEQNNGCGGGNANTAYEDLMEIGGVFSTDCIPYQGAGMKHCPGFAYSWNGAGAAGDTGRFVRIDQELQQSCSDLTRYTNRPPMGPEWDMPFTMMYESRFGAVADPNDVRLERFRKNFAKSRARDRLSSWWLYGEEAMKTAVTKYGSIYASYEARNDFSKRICETGCWPPGTVWGEESFEPSRGEFIESNCGCASGHAVHIIGYGTDIQETGMRIPYWLIENSWGQDHGNILGEDSEGVKGFGKDPFTELHPMGIEDQCVIAGWLASSVPRTGGCGGNADVNIRDDIEITDGPPDGFVFAIDLDGEPLLQVDVAPDTGRQQFYQSFPMSPGDHEFKLMVYSRNHPKQQALALEKYKLTAVSVRCRGRGFRYSFTKNDIAASLSWGRKTRQQLRAEVDQLLLANGIREGQRFENCPEVCRTGSYSEIQPCIGLLSNWGTCYTEEWAINHEFYQERGTMCDQCAPLLVAAYEEALAIQQLDNATFLQWHNLVTEALTAPDEPGWMRQFYGSCVLESMGHATNTQLSATYHITMPNTGSCNEQHSAPFEQGQFVHAPGTIHSGESALTRCPLPLKGDVQLACNDGVLTVTDHTCEAPGAVNTTALGYFKMLRGHDYHGIEEGASFAIAEMARFGDLCPTTGWTRWSECTAHSPCEPGMQSRSREPTDGADRTSMECSNLQFEETRPCVSPGFCPQVLTRMLAGGTADVNGFLEAYRSQSYSLGSYPTAGSHFLNSANPPCQDAQFWCNLTTGTSNCGMYFEGHFEVKESGEYILSFQVEEGSGELEFNTFGEGDEMKPELKVVSATGSGAVEMFSWQDYGFHHRRRRTDRKPWERVSSFALSQGHYFARMTRVGWSECPNFTLKLERSNSRYMPPLLTGQSSYGLRSHGAGDLVRDQVQWGNHWGAQDRTYRSWYTPATEMSSENEILIRHDYGIPVYCRKNISKLNFTGQELYDLCNFTDKSQPVDSSNQYSAAELVIRSTVIIPDAGQYKFKYQQDTEITNETRLWMSDYRRRSTYAIIRAGQTATSTYRAYDSNSAELTVSYEAAEPGTTTFEVSTLLMAYSAQGYFTLPNYFAVEMKKEDILHGSSLEFGSKTRYLSNLDILSGDMQARVDWPDRDDPLSSELKIQSFKEIDPETYFIGERNYTGFAAEAEGVIDAGACLSLQARTTGNEDIRGVSLELCDVDGSAQYLEVATFKIIDGRGENRTRIGWVHIGFNQPTHLRIVRSPVDLTSFEISYRPDDRNEFAPLNLHQTASGTLLGGYTGPMDVGVSLSTQESYRYAEFYNISVAECPTTCGDPQIRCGMQTTACGTELDCPSTCPDSGVCYDGICMSCPPLPDGTASWECGTVAQVCSNPAGQQMQVHRTLGFEGPAHQVCTENHTWACRPRSRFHYLTEGMECGIITDECGATIELFDCPRAADRCQDHTCICHPHEFPSSYNCGSQSDGCGTTVYFGTQSNGACPGENDVCVGHMCCTARTAEDFDPTWECGEESDGCEGMVNFGTCAWPSECNSTTHLCQEAPYVPPTWTSVTGDCVHTPEDGCVTSPNYPQNYGLRQSCVTTVGGETDLGHLEVDDFETEGYWDRITIGSTRYSGRRRNYVSRRRPRLTAGDRLPVTGFSWTSDYYRTFKGWKICIRDGPLDPASSLLAEAAGAVEEEEDAEEEDADEDRRAEEDDADGSD